MSTRWTFSVVQDGMEVALGEATIKAEAQREANHYAMMYGQDGPVTTSVRRATPEKEGYGWRSG
jgi:predicted component of type VI protein secretion system